MKDLLEKLNIAPTYDDYRDCRYRLIEVAQNIAEVGVEITREKELVAIREAELVEMIKKTEEKITIKEIESRIRKELKQENEYLIELKAKEMKMKAQYEAVDKFLRAVD